MRTDRIEMVPYDPAWASQFAEQARRLRLVLGDHLVRDLEHIGSTAVPGLCAKAIIDMLAVVDDVHAVESLSSDLAALSWVRDPESRDSVENRLSFCFPSRERRTHHLHVVLVDHGGWRGWVAFRNRLRRDKDARDEYGALKLRLAEDVGSDPNDRDGYRSGKADLIWRITSTELDSQ